VNAGDRLPWVPPAEPGGDDNFTPLASRRWQVHVYGAEKASPEVRAACAALNIEVHQFAWHAAARRAGMARGALYLVRPDGYVAFASDVQDASALRHVWDRIRGNSGA